MSDQHLPAHGRSSSNLFMAAALIASGTALWVGGVLRHPGALAMLPGIDGCLTAGVFGVLLALLHGVPYRTALLYLGAPIVLVQLGVTAAIGVSFFGMLGLELTAFGIFGLPFSRWPARRAPARLRGSILSPAPDHGGTWVQTR